MPWKNSTLLTVPSLSEAFAPIVMLAGAVNVAVLNGLVILITGATLAGELTITLVALETVVAPELSVALAVKL